MKDKFIVTAGLVAIFAGVVLAGGCRISLEDEIRADFAKVPDYLLGTKHRCQAFVLYTFARMEDIPDETRRMKVLYDFTDRLFSVDISQACPLENVGWEKSRIPCADYAVDLIRFVWLPRMPTSL